VTEQNAASPRPWRRSRQSYETRASELLEQERQQTRAHHRLLAETVLGILMCCVVGLFLVSWAVHTTDARLGGVSFWSGLLIGDVGMVVLLLRHQQKSDEAGF
jgi:hypothetical protein